MRKTIHSTFSHHTLYIESIPKDALPVGIQDREVANYYTTFYRVRNFDAKGIVFFYLARGYRHPNPEYAHDKKAHAPRAIVVWYGNGAFYTGGGNTFQEAIEGAQEHGWLAACRPWEG